MTSLRSGGTPEPVTGPDPADEVLPTFSEQVADQLGGARGMIESSIPVAMFVLVNIVWSLTPAVAVSVITALGIAGYRLYRKEAVRHALNGLFGIGIGAYLAYRTGDPEDFYLPGILLSLGYAIAMALSVAFRRPLVGWIWAILTDRGATRWRDDGGLRRTFSWLTLVWAATYLAKVLINSAVYFSSTLTHDQKSTLLGIMRIVLTYPPYALLFALTVWAVRRYLRGQAPTPEPA